MKEFRPDTSFPFLAIAVRYGIPYGQILAYAEALGAYFGGAPDLETIRRGIPIFERDPGACLAVHSAIYSERKRRDKIGYSKLWEAVAAARSDAAATHKDPALRPPL
jgi:hypothetical protein